MAYSDDARVREYMTTDVLTVGPDTPVPQIVAVLAGQAISGLPVVDGDRVVGIVSEGDLVMREKPLHMPAAISFLGEALMIDSPKQIDTEFKKHFGATAKDIMTSHVYTVAPDAALSAAAQLMVDKDVKRLPVVENGKLVGILTRKDLVRALL
jgi:CBS domain-containing protein